MSETPMTDADDMAALEHEIFDTALATNAGRELMAGAAVLRAALQTVVDNPLCCVKNICITALSTNAGREMLAELEYLKDKAETERIARQEAHEATAYWEKRAVDGEADLATLKRKLAAAEGMAEALQRAAGGLDWFKQNHPLLCGTALDRERDQMIISALAAWNAANQPTP